MEEIKEKIYKSIRKLEKWVELQDYKGYEPFEGNSSFLHFLTFNNQFLERILQQVVRQSPLNLRPLFGISKKESTKGRGYMAWGYLSMYKATNEENYLNKAKDCLEWLDNNKAPKYKNHSWGNHFLFSSRGGKLPAFEPIIVWTSLIGQAYIDAYEILNDKKYLDIANSICDWILDLPRLETNQGDCISYVKYTSRMIHNSNMLGAAMLARTSKHVRSQDRKKELLKVAKNAIVYSCSRQLTDGSWWYGEEGKYHWIDNFHTGYNLDSLKCYIASTGDKEFEEYLNKGFDFYKTHFFEKNGRSKYYHDRTYPIDSQCVSQAIETLANFSDYDNESLDLAIRVATWWMTNMQDRKGYFYYRQYPLGIKAKTPMLHWAQTTTYKGLTVLLSKL